MRDDDVAVAHVAQALDDLQLLSVALASAFTDNPQCRYGFLVKALFHMGLDAYLPYS